MSHATVENVAIVTGVASRVGLGIAQRLARDCAKVAFLDLNGAAADAAGAKIRADSAAAFAGAVDVADRESADRALAEVRTRFSPVTVLVNNAGEEGLTVPPPFIDTPMTRRNEANSALGKGVDHHASLTPVRQPGRPVDVAAACAFLLSDEAGYITGQVIGVNGGRNN